MKILSVDDHVLFAKSLELLFPDVTFRTVYCLEHLEKTIADFKPDILLMDIRLGNGEDGLKGIRQLLRVFPDLNIVILTGYNLPVYQEEARRAGAKAFLGKEVEPEQLKAVLTHVAAGVTFFEAGESLPEYLTDAESQVLAMTAKGMKRRAIAETLSLSERTVSNHLQHVFEKLEVNSALEAVAKARALGYLPPT